MRNRFVFIAGACFFVRLRYTTIPGAELFGVILCAGRNNIPPAHNYFCAPGVSFGTSFV